MSAPSLEEVLEACSWLEDGRAFSADLHVHSTVSDGSDPAAAIVADAAARGLTHVALTNHDTTAGIDAAVEAGREAGVQVVGGVEISAYDATRGRKVHVLGLGLHEKSRAVEELCAETLARRDTNSRWQLDVLLDAGYDVDCALVERLCRTSGVLYKQHIMAGLTSEPYGSEAYGALYRSLFKGDGICARDIVYVDVRNAVAAIVADGGYAVLAHPGQLDSWDIVGDLASCGLSGIEAAHPDHDACDERRARDAAEAYGLFCTAGSDYHGRFGAVPHVGFRRVKG